MKFKVLRIKKSGEIKQIKVGKSDRENLLNVW